MILKTLLWTVSLQNLSLMASLHLSLLNHNNAYIGVINFLLLFLEFESPLKSDFLIAR